MSVPSSELRSTTPSTASEFVFPHLGPRGEEQHSFAGKGRWGDPILCGDDKLETDVVLAVTIFTHWDWSNRDLGQPVRSTSASTFLTFLAFVRKRESQKGADPLKTPHCNENPIYVFPEKELLCLSPNFHIHVSMSYLYIPRIGPHIFLQQNRQTHRGNI